MKKRGVRRLKSRVQTIDECALQCVTRIYTCTCGQIEYMAHVSGIAGSGKILHDFSVYRPFFLT